MTKTTISLKNTARTIALPLMVVALFLATSTSSNADKSPAIGVINQKKLLESSSAFKKFQEQVKSVEGSFKDLVTKHLKEIDAAAGKVLEQKDTLSSEELNKKVTSLTSRQKEVTQRDQETAKKIEAALKPAMEQIKKAVDAAIAKVAKAKKLDIVIDEMSAAYTSPNFDITTEVAKELNASLKEVKVSFPKIS